MSNFMENLDELTSVAKTENGAITNKSSKDDVVNFFFSIGNLRDTSKTNPNEVIKIFRKAFIQSPEDTLKILFYLRDVRGGQGERNAFKVILTDILKNEVYKNIDVENKKVGVKFIHTLFSLCREFGRVDDYIKSSEEAIRSFTSDKKPKNKWTTIKINTFVNTLLDPMVDIIFGYIRQDLKLLEANPKNKKGGIQKCLDKLNKDVIKYEDSLFFKWVPRQDYITRLLVNRLSQRITGYLQIKTFRLKKEQLVNTFVDRTTFRKMLVRCSDTMEQKVQTKQYDLIKLDKVSALSLKRHWKNLNNNIPTRLKEFLEGLKSGEVKVNSTTLYPYDVISFLKKGEKELANSSWDNLKDYLPEGFESDILPVIDVSGSMESPEVIRGVSPMDVAISLGVYLAQRNKNEDYRNKFLTFHESPELISFQGLKTFSDIYNKVKYSPWGMNTNLYKTMKIISEACQNGVTPPKAIIIFSDMEFDQSGNTEKTLYKKIKKNLFTKEGIEIPKIIFWNIAKKTKGNYPVKATEDGTILVGGFSPSLFPTLIKFLETGETLNSMTFVQEVTTNERYKNVTKLVPFLTK